MKNIITLTLAVLCLALQHVSAQKRRCCSSCRTVSLNWPDSRP